MNAEDWREADNPVTVETVTTETTKGCIIDCSFCDRPYTAIIVRKIRDGKIEQESTRLVDHDMSSCERIKKLHRQQKAQNYQTQNNIKCCKNCVYVNEYERDYYCERYGRAQGFDIDWDGICDEYK